MTLLTNVEEKNVSNGSNPLPAQGFFPSRTTRMKNGWIQRGGRDFLWLPQAYCISHVELFGSTFAFGQKSG